MKDQYPYYRHLTLMECRKDIISQNNFINLASRDQITGKYQRYRTKMVDNKYRLYYLAAFTIFFNLNFIYDYIFHSNSTFNRIRDYIFDRTNQKSILEQKSINISDSRIKKLVAYYHKLDKQFSPEPLSGKNISLSLMEFSQFGNQEVPAQTFIEFCLKNDLNPQ